MDNLTPTDRELLSAVARHEVLHDACDGHDYRWRHPHGGGLPERVPVDPGALARLDGLVELPPTTERLIDRYWDLTDAALRPADSAAE